MGSRLAVSLMVVAPLLGAGGLAAQHPGRQHSPQRPGSQQPVVPPGGQPHSGQPARPQGQEQPPQVRPRAPDQFDSAIAASRRARQAQPDSGAAARRPDSGAASQRPATRDRFTPEQHRQHDSAFAAMQRRGQTVMGVNQYTSSHRIDALPDGGRIELQRDVDDPQGVATIRRHLADLASHFADGHFVEPGRVHEQDVPGTAVMAAKRAVITYGTEVLPRGAALRITSSDPEAVAAIHQFLEFQRREHRTEQRH